MTTKKAQPSVTMPATPPALQHDLFEITDGISHPEFRVYTNILEIWDLLPKYDPYGANKRYHEELDINEMVRKIPVRHKVHREQLISDAESFVDLELHISPARIERRKRVWMYEGEGTKRRRKRVFMRDDNGDYIIEPTYVYPGLREDKVEEALKYLLSHGQGQFDSERIGVTFSVKQIQRELKRTGATYSLDEIKESLEVLSRSRCEIFGLDADGKKRSVMASTFLPNLLMVDRDTYAAKRTAGETETTHCYAQFHAAVTMSIQTNQFRISHYDKHQNLDNLLSRYIHKILRTSFTNASRNGKPYSLSYERLMSEFGRGNDRNDSNMRLLNTSLRDLTRANIISHHEVEVINDLKDRRNVIDRIYQLYPTDEFVREIIDANSRHKRNLELFTDFHTTKQIGQEVNDLGSEERKVHKELMGWRISSSRALELLKLYPMMLIRRCLTEVRTQQQSGKLKNPSGYILKALEEGWFADSDFEPGSALEHEESEEIPDEDLVAQLSDVLKQNVLDAWPRWDRSTRATFNKYGLNSPHIREKLDLPI